MCPYYVNQMDFVCHQAKAIHVAYACLPYKVRNDRPFTVAPLGQVWLKGNLNQFLGTSTT